MSQPKQNVLQDLLAATIEGASPNGEVLNQLAMALQNLHLDCASLGACYFHAGGEPRCYNLTREECSLIPGSSFDPTRLGVVHGAFTGPAAAAMGFYLRNLGLDPFQPETNSKLLFALHLAPDLTPEDIFHAHLEWARCNTLSPNSPLSNYPNDPDPGRHLRLGYVSADFRAHVMGWYIGPVLECHDRQRFEVFCYANVARADDTTRRHQALAEHWRDILGVGDAEVADQIRRDRIDLLVDLNGHTDGHRLTLFARRPAPVQASHFGYMETSGLDAIDYRITDAVCDPPGRTECYHTEQLVRLPEIAWCYRPDVAPEVNDLPAASAGHVTFGMFNACPKITSPAVAAWAELLRRLPDTRLLLLAAVNSQANRCLLDAFAGHGIASDRVTLERRRPRPDYFRLYHQVDIALDTFPFTGCNTTCDALWMGVPVVTLAGQACIARQGASPLAHLGLHELITDTADDYVDTAVRLAGDLPRLAERRATLRERMNRTTLMNPSRFTRQLEEAYRWMWRQWCLRSPHSA